MQSKGAIRLVAILLALACLWQLSFTLVNSIYENKAKKYAEESAAAFQNSAAFSNVPLADQAFYLDSLKKEQQKRYTDSLSSEKVYLGHTFKDVQAKQINLGLDLKGGMNVMLQVQLEDLIKALAGDNTTPAFEQALALAKERSVSSQSDLITLFGDAWKEVAGGQRLAQIFGTYELRDRITPESSDDAVLSVIRDEAESAVANSFNVLRNRIDRFGVTSPSIQKIGNTGRILVELPGVKEPERVRKLLQGTASLEFWTTYEYSEIYPYLVQANALLAELLSDDQPSAAEEQEQAEEQSDILSEEISASDDQTDDAQMELYKKQNPLFSVLQLSQMNGNACLGFASTSDMAVVDRYLSIPQVADLFPAEFIPMWSAKPSSFFNSDNVYELVAIKASSRDGKAPLDGDVVTDARVSYSNQRTSANPTVSMSMNAEGANTWARLTRENIGRQIAIVLDGAVYSYPTVNGEISGGNSEISGNFTVEEATDLTNVLKSGKLPAPATIVQEQVVGPSLGAESIRSGLISFIIAFVLVLLFMIFFYRGAGVAADIALLTNVVLLFGTLAAFGAVLTLPGIAGLVLTLGMAVDANVIIYERIKEELKAGKGIGLAIKDGYKNAYSAIIDGQITTLLTGIVLFVFGSGPIQGFATTLIIGIITSVLTSIFITRLILDSRVARGKDISFDSKLTRNFLKNTHIDFLGARKWSYIISGCLILIAILSMAFKGFTYGVDFTGGRTYVVRFDKPVQAEDVREAVLDVFNNAATQNGVSNSSAEVKQFGGDSQMKITTSYKYENESTDVDAEIEGMLYQALKPFFTEDLPLEGFISTLDNPNGIISSDKVGATIANDIKRSAVISVILALIVIFGYIAMRFRKWTWGLGGVVSLAHTTIIVIGFFSLFSGILPFNLDVDQTFIAAILTIIGYAINDNVVIFDRIRENLAKHPNANFKDTVNESLNATLTRTVNTSLSTLLPMLAIAIFGGESIRGLAVALVLGVIIGTYASIMIGTPVMYDVTMKNASKNAAKAPAKK
ncbi:MAG: protein translocase subunit SecDF [Bacteroidales bacterium]|nr:protein translocase subunit SecDF [Bacteroidales bacterium]MBR3285442.1 protein translocase subunit SecDF [Bacteroidales bacterium]